MGTGRLRNGKYDVTVVANFAMAAADWTDWERAFTKASEILFDASDGQLEFGTFYACDESVGLDTADFVLYDAGDPSYNSGTFGSPGAAMHLMPYVKNAVLTVLHEWGHHAWGLREEYAGPLLSDEIDETSPAPDNATIPIVDSGRADDELVALQAQAILKFGTSVERKLVTANTATRVTVAGSFSDLPTNSDDDSVYYQTPAECASAAGADFCIMEKSRTAAGQFDATGTWVPAANPVTEFCADSNHDPDGDTQQEDSHGRSCWEIITATPGYTGLTTPDPAAAGPTTGFGVPDWIVLDKQPRFALVLDRSGSMSAGNKMADAQHGAVYWLEFCAESDDQLAIVWYDHAIDRILDLTQVGSLPDLQAQTNAIEALAPRGSTNIRDGLFAGLDEIQTPATRAAVQVALLLTDGKHNTPFGSSAVEVLPDFQNGGVRIYALGVGTPANVDMDVLDELASETGGRSYAVGDDDPGEVEAAMVEINAEVRGGIVTTQPALMPDLLFDAPLEKVGRLVKERGEKRPPLAELLEILGVDTLQQLLRPDERSRRSLVAVPAEIEKGCERASFALVHPAGRELWLYLIDPSGNPVDMNDASVHHVTSDAPHEFAIVERPEPGRWTMVALRPLPGAAFSFRAVAGAENRRLQAFGGAPPRNPRGPVRVWAAVRWGETLSDVDVRASIRDAGGGHHSIVLSDETVEEPNSGEYEGLFVPKRAGRHSGLITIRNRGSSSLARWVHRLRHLEDGEDTVPAASDAPRFVRRIRFTFDVGERPDVKDEEVREGLPARYQRPRKGKPQSVRVAAAKTAG